MNMSALLVIDLLNDFFRNGPLARRRPELVTATNCLIDGFRKSDQPIIWVRQEFNADLSDAFLEMRRENIRITIAGTEGARILPELDVQLNDTVIIKKRYSAFYCTTLDDILAKFRPAVLVVCGVNTHACIRTTVIDAYQRDYDVVVAADCTASYDEEHHEITKQYLDNRAARFLSNEEILKMVATNRATG